MKKALPVVLLTMLAGAAAASASVPASGSLAPRAISEGLPSPPLQPPKTARDLDSLLGGLDFFSLIANPKAKNGFTLSGRPALRDDSFENRLKKAAKTDGTVVENLYDAQGRKVRESVTVAGNTRTTDYVLSGDQVLEEYAGTSLSARYVHGRGIDETVRAELDTNADGTLDTTVFPIQTETGDLERLTDASGATVERYDYQGYGKFRIFDPAGGSRSVSSYGWKWLFQGREYQTSLNAYDFRARTLWPELGRFAQEDPLEDHDRGLEYPAFDGNWGRFTDPRGLQYEPPDIHPFAPNWGAAMGLMHYSHHSVKLTLPERRPSGYGLNEVRKEIYTELERFTWFDKPTENIARLTLHPPRGRFTIKNLFMRFGNAAAGNSIDVEFVNRPSNFEVQAVTLGRHPLVGSRKWSVEPVQGEPNTLRVKTHAYEQSSRLLNYAMHKVGLAQRMQNEMWTIYIENIAKAWESKWQVKVTREAARFSVGLVPPNPFRSELPPHLQVNPLSPD